MSIKWRNKIFKAGIVSLAFLLTINPLDLNSVIRANEEVKEEKTVNSNRTTEFYNNQDKVEINGNGTIDMKKIFFFKGIARKNGKLQVLNNDQVTRTASYIDETGTIEKTGNIAKILTARNVAGMDDDKQTIIGTSRFTVDLRRDFEIEGSFSMKNKEHGFIFSLHGNENYQPKGTDDSLGVYYNSNEPYTIGGLENAFVMEVDTYAGSGNFGDNYIGNKTHVSYNETSSTGGLKYQNNKFVLGKHLKTIPIDTAANGNLFTLNKKAGENNHVRFIFKWDESSKRASITFADTLARYNLPDTYIDVLEKLQRNNNGRAYISIGGTTDWAGKNFMEVGIHRIKYNDLDPTINTKVSTESGKEVIAVYPGQKIKVKHYLYNKNKTLVDINDDIKLHMLYLQFLNKDEISNTIPASKNFEPKNVNMWVEDGNGYITDKVTQTDFNGNNPLPVKFPSEGRYYVIEYYLTVPSDVDKVENYYKEFYLFFQTKLGQRGIEGISIKEQHLVRLLPKLESRNNKGNPIIHEKHEVFKYTGGWDNGKAMQGDVLDQLWNELYLTSSVDRAYKLNKTNIKTPNETIINKSYYVYDNGNISKFTNNNIPSRFSKTSSITLAIEIIDKKLDNLKTYYYRTIVVGDSFSLSNDGDYIIFGKNLNKVDDTELNTMRKEEFIKYINENGGVKAIHRDSENAMYELSNFSKHDTNIDISDDWIWNDKIDLSVSPNFVDKNQLISIYIKNKKEISTNIILPISANTIQVDDGIGNNPNGQTAYIIIPSNIRVRDDNTNHDKINGIGMVYLSGYSTRKKFDIWVDKSVQLRSSTETINLTSRNLNGVNNSNNGNNREYLGEINQSKNINNPLRVELSGVRYKGKPTTFKGNLTFYIGMK